MTVFTVMFGVFALAILALCVVDCPQRPGWRFNGWWVAGFVIALTAGLLIVILMAAIVFRTSPSGFGVF